MNLISARLFNLFFILILIFITFPLLHKLITEILVSKWKPEFFDEAKSENKFTRKILKSCGDFCDLINPLFLDNGSIKAKASTVSYVYLTFDDAPNDGTEHVLDALKKAGVKATFFVVGFKLVTPKDPPMLVSYQKVIMRMIEEGHLVADHSYDHMLHNIEANPKKSTYVGVEDILWFGKKNIDAVTGVMRASGFNKEKVVNVINTMWNYVRLPYTNNWRVGAIKSSEGGSATVKLSDALGSDGALVFGWDIEWAIDWSNTRYTYGGEKMFQRLNKSSSTKTKGKTVIISHDKAHRPGGNFDAETELVKFLTLAKEKGFQFRTVDTYLTD